MSGVRITGGQKNAWAASVGGYIFSHKLSGYDPGCKNISYFERLVTELKRLIKLFFKKVKNIFFGYGLLAFLMYFCAFAFKNKLYIPMRIPSGRNTSTRQRKTPYAMV